MNIKITNKGHRRGFIQGKMINPGESVELKDVDKDGLKQLNKVQWLAVEKVLKAKKVAPVVVEERKNTPRFKKEAEAKIPRVKEEDTTNEVTE